MNRGVERGRYRISRLLAFVGTSLAVACASSNYAPVVYHESNNSTGGAAVISTGDPSASVNWSSTTPSTGAALTPVESEALSTTETPAAPAPSASPVVEAEQPHGLAPQGSSAESIPIESQGADQTLIAHDAPVPLGVDRPYAVTVQPGDTVYSLARAHGVEPQAIIEANRLAPPYRLRIGDSLTIPKGGYVAAAASGAPMTVSTPVPPHVVVAGDTLYSIARAEDADLRQIALINHLSPPYRLKVGESLQLPARSKTIRIASEDPPAAASGGPLLHIGQQPMAPLSAPKPPAAKTQSTSVTKAAFIWPVSGRIISSYGRKQSGRTNDGVNIAVPIGSPVRAARAGEVIYVGNEIKGYGNLVLIRHDDGYVSAYAHNSKVLVQRGAFVQQGQEIAESGETGNVDVPQVHFEIRKDRKPVDPIDLLPKI